MSRSGTQNLRITAAALLLAAALGPGPALAQKPGKAPATKAAAAKPAARPASSAEAPATTPAPAPAPPEKGVQGEGKAATGKEGASGVVQTQEGKEGVKTYKFGAVEVEGRLRSPQLIYFLRRVRAEFLAGDLGHRSFLPELSDSQRGAPFR